jgi:DNA-directed RNA polymerase specialized sigma24 family protein
MSTESRPNVFSQREKPVAATGALPPLRTPLALALEDDDLYEGLQKFVRRRVAHPEDAEDVLGVAMERAMRRERYGEPWDPNGPLTAGLHMMKIIKGALANRQQSKQRHPLDAVEDIDVFASEDTSPAEVVAERLVTDECRRHANDLHRSLVATGEDPVVVAILESIADGVVEHSEIAARIGCTYDEVRLGFRRLARHAQTTVNVFRQQSRFQ